MGTDLGDDIIDVTFTACAVPLRCIRLKEITEYSSHIEKEFAIYLIERDLYDPHFYGEHRFVGNDFFIADDSIFLKKHDIGLFDPGLSKQQLIDFINNDKDRVFTYTSTHGFHKQALKGSLFDHMCKDLDFDLFRRSPEAVSTLSRRSWFKILNDKSLFREWDAKEFSGIAQF